MWEIVDTQGGHTKHLGVNVYIKGIFIVSRLPYLIFDFVRKMQNC